MSSSIVFEEVTFYTFLIVCIVLFSRVFIYPAKFLTLPVMTGAIWLAYIAPQAFGILYNPIHLPPDLFQYGYGKTMIMCLLCALMGVWGWSVGLRRERLRATVESAKQLNSFRLMVAGSVLTALGILAFLFITRQTGGVIGYYSVGGNYGLDWLGGEVIAVFFMEAFLNTAIIILLFSFFLRPRLLTALVALIALAPSLADILILNRRSDVIYLAVAITAPAFFLRNWAPSRQMLIIAVVGGLFVVFTFPIIRGAYVIGSERSVNIAEAFTEALFANVLGGNQHKEFNNSVGFVASSDYLGEFGYGAINWNRWVSTTVPRTFFGEGFKEFLSFRDITPDNIGTRAFGWIPVWYQSRSAAAMLFIDFWYFGSFVFFLIGFVFARMYDRAIRGNVISQIKYSVFLLLLPHWVAVGFYKAPRNIILTLIIVSLVAGYARIKRPRKYRVFAPRHARSAR